VHKQPPDLPPIYQGIGFEVGHWILRDNVERALSTTFIQKNCK